MKIEKALEIVRAIRPRLMRRRGNHPDECGIRGSRRRFGRQRMLRRSRALAENAPDRLSPGFRGSGVKHLVSGAAKPVSRVYPKALATTPAPR